MILCFQSILEPTSKKLQASDAEHCNYSVSLRMLMGMLRGSHGSKLGFIYDSIGSL